MLSSYKIDGYLVKSFNYLPYKYSIFFTKPFSYSKNLLEANNQTSEKLYYLLNTTEKKSALDYSYWNNKLLYQISNNIDLNDFEKNFQNSAILSKKNLNLKKSLKLFYLRNIPRFSKETRDIVMSN